MKTTKALFSELMYDFQSERWNEFELSKLSLRELLALAKLLGYPSCGSKETVIVRLLAATRTARPFLPFLGPLSLLDGESRRFPRVFFRTWRCYRNS